MKKVLFLLVFAAAAVAAHAQTPANQSDKSTTPVKIAMPMLKTAKDSASYAYGIVLGNSLKRQMTNADLNNDLVIASIKSTIGDEQMAFSSEEASKIYNDYQKAVAAKAGEANKKAGEIFLTENKKRKEVVTTASGLQYEILTKGGDQNGPKPVATDKVKVHYHGTLITGEVFDSSVQRGEPAEFPLNGVIKGWTEGVQYMHVGDKFRFYIPYQLAYGERGAGAKIKPFSTLVFDVELLAITTSK